MRSIKLSVVRLPTYHSAAITVKEEELEGSVLTEAQRLLDDSLHIDDSMVKVNLDGQAAVLISNRSNTPCLFECGREIARASLTNQKFNKSLEQICFIGETTEELTSLNSGENTGSTEVIQAQHPEHVKVWAANTLANGTVCSNEPVKWRQQQLQETFLKISNNYLYMEHYKLYEE